MGMDYAEGTSVLAVASGAGIKTRQQEKQEDVCNKAGFLARHTVIDLFVPCLRRSMAVSNSALYIRMVIMLHRTVL